MSTLRPGLPPLPPKMTHLPIDDRGFPVPFFVAIIDGKPDHRIADPKAMKICVEQRRCWICGGQLGVFKAFLIGPMCAITRTISEPPSHRECATYAAIACPFLTRPHAHRREAGLPEARHHAPGNPIMRNPGAVCVWVTSHFHLFRSTYGNAGWLFELGAPEETRWYAEGRQATRAEVDESIASGLPLLTSEVEKDTAPGAMADLARRVAAVGQMLDADALLNGRV